MKTKHSRKKAPVWAKDTTTPARDAFAGVLAESVDGNEFHPDRFFVNWFQREGSAYFFLFKKNLGVTNIQCAELLALIQQHVTSVSYSPTGQLLHFATDDFKALISTIIVPFVKNAAGDIDFKGIARRYESVFARAIVVNVYYTSCTVYLPPGLSLDLAHVCFESGYVHSCGRTVYVRNIEKAEQSEFFAAISDHLDRFGIKNDKAFFAPYAHEDFSEYDHYTKHVKDELRHGLDDVKIHVEKDSMGMHRLTHVLSELRERFGDRLEVPEPGDFREKHKGYHDRTYWLIRDATVNPSDFGKPGERKYYMCYEQLFFNANPFHIFDENKPAWISHTTIPHTLLGAMINITRPWPRREATVIVDPFAGTGTTWLETLKFPEARARCSDLSPIVPLLVHDNARFFGQDLKALDGLIARYTRVLEPEQLELPSLFVDRQTGPDPFHTARELIEELRRAGSSDGQSFVFTDKFVENLKRCTFFQRLTFYTALRAELRFQGAFERGSRAWVDAFKESARDLHEQMKSLREWRSAAGSPDEERGALVIYRGQYSKWCSVSAHRLASAQSSFGRARPIRVRDARELSERSCDVVVTDPPYGFNTDDELSTLAGLYSDVIDRLVRIVKSGGHLVICLPEASYTGRELPFCTLSGLVVAQLLSAASQAGREVTARGESLPAPANLFRTPFYWISERALRRVILHFQIQDRA